LILVTRLGITSGSRLPTYFQDQLYRRAGKRVETRTLYIRNAMEKAGDKPRSKDVTWPDDINTEAERLRKIISDSQSLRIIFLFGAFAYDFGRRALGQERRKHGQWGATTLGDAFRRALAEFRPEEKNLIPSSISVFRGEGCCRATGHFAA
jgi:hypothetical protein